MSGATAAATTGKLSVLSVGVGDIRVTFNHNDSDERRKAIAMLVDLQRRGYFIAVEMPDGTYARATQIDATRGRYIVTVPADTPPRVETPNDIDVTTRHQSRSESVTPSSDNLQLKRTRGRPRKRVSIPVEEANAVAVARSAGG